MAAAAVASDMATALVAVAESEKSESADSLRYEPLRPVRLARLLD
jgi:hypothetical protein